MKCTHCNAATRVLSTRERQEFYVVRRHACPNGHRFNTVEVLETLLKKFARKRVAELLALNQRGAAIRRQAFERERVIRAKLKAGEKQIAIAAELGVSEGLVRKHANRMHKEARRAAAA